MDFLCLLSVFSDLWNDKKDVSSVKTFDSNLALSTFTFLILKCENIF